MFLLIAPVAIGYPEIKATEAKASKLKILPLQLLFQNIYNKTGGMQRNTLYRFVVVLVAAVIDVVVATV